MRGARWQQLDIDSLAVIWPWAITLPMEMGICEAFDQEMDIIYTASNLTVVSLPPIKLRQLLLSMRKQM